MGTEEWLMLTGIGAVVAGLVALAFLLGNWRAERRLSRQHVLEMRQQREGLAAQRMALQQQREYLAEQRASLDARRTERMPDTGRVRPRPESSGGDGPTVMFKAPHIGKHWRN